MIALVRNKYDVNKPFDFFVTALYHNLQLPGGGYSSWGSRCDPALQISDIFLYHLTIVSLSLTSFYKKRTNQKKQTEKKQKQFTVKDDNEDDDDDDDDEEADHVRNLHRSIVTIETIFVFGVAVGKYLNDQKHQQSWDKKQQQD